MRELRFGRLGPKEADGLVVFLHGYGADGADLLGLADVLGPQFPRLAFVAPDAPEPCAGGGFGRQWFPIPRFDGSTEAMAAAGVDASAAELNVFLDGRLADEGLGPDRLVLFGFSQGAMMSLYVAPRRSPALAGVVAFSGRLLRPETLAAETMARPPVLLLHGDQDPVVPFVYLDEAAGALSAAGFPTQSHIMRNAGHTISSDGFMRAQQFLQERLS